MDICSVMVYTKLQHTGGYILTEVLTSLNLKARKGRGEISRQRIESSCNVSENSLMFVARYGLTILAISASHTAFIKQFPVSTYIQTSFHLPSKTISSKPRI